jgi:rhodanese-related sulfurtransferase
VNFVVENWYLFVLALLSGGMLLLPTLKSAGAGALSAAQAVQLMNRERAVVIDVCEPDEFAAGHVGGSKNVPLGQLQERLPQVVKNKTLPMILVCAKGARAQRAVGIAKSLGYDKAQALAGGLAAWKQASMPVEKS